MIFGGCQRHFKRGLTLKGAAYRDTGSGWIGTNKYQTIGRLKNDGGQNHVFSGCYFIPFLPGFVTAEFQSDFPETLNNFRIQRSLPPQRSVNDDVRTRRHCRKRQGRPCRLEAGAELLADGPALNGNRKPIVQVAITADSELMISRLDRQIG